jgi:hypothetical protein
MRNGRLWTVIKKSDKEEYRDEYVFKLLIKHFTIEDQGEVNYQKRSALYWIDCIKIRINRTYSECVYKYKEEAYQIINEVPKISSLVYTELEFLIFLRKKNDETVNGWNV